MHCSFSKDGHLNMLGGYLEFFMKPALAETYLSLKRELEELIQKKVSYCVVLTISPKFNILQISGYVYLCQPTRPFV